MSSQDVVDQLKGITCCPYWDEGTLVRSSPDAVALALQRFIANGQSLVTNDDHRLGQICLECGGVLPFRRGVRFAYLVGLVSVNRGFTNM